MSRAEAVNDLRGGDAHSEPVLAAPSETAKSPAFAAKTNDLEAIRSAVVDAAGVSGGLWLSYSRLIAGGGVTHRDLFLDNSDQAAIPHIELPLKGFFWLGPALFLVVHTYVLLTFCAALQLVTPIACWKGEL